ncbi:MAG: hypothetical protein U0528_13215 [Anaerolineae bacterium]
MQRLGARLDGSGTLRATNVRCANAGSAWIDWSRVNQHADAQIAHYYIRGRADSNIETLSGGNQQRTLIALLPEDLKLLLLEDPTRGLDVESVRWVWSQLLDRRQHGAAILFTSPDLDEIIEYSDRVLVFYGGEVSTVDDPANISVTQASLIGENAHDTTTTQTRNHLVSACAATCCTSCAALLQDDERRDRDPAGAADGIGDPCDCVADTG